MAQKKLKYLFILSFTLVGAACAPNKKSTQQLASTTEDTAACTNFHEKMVDVVVDSLMQDQEEIPTAAELESELRQRFSERKDLHQGQIDQLIKTVVANYRTLTEETEKSLNTKNRDELIAAMTALEIGDRSDENRAKLQQKLASGFAKAQKQAQIVGLACAEPPPTNPEPGSPVIETPVDPQSDFSKQALPVQGAVRVLTTAYQSCQASRVPAMTTSSPDVEGIKVIGTHPNGVGRVRQVGNLKLLQQTHYYIREGSDSLPSCFQVPEHPLIYDYGGKPYARTEDTAPLNLFKNAGTGGDVLGIDCSGYIFSALAASGLRLAPGKKLKASLVYGVNARMMMSPENNGLTCLGTIGASAKIRLQDGDILASTGHVVMLDQVGVDPFGLSRIKKAGDCVEGIVSHRNFDFDILQSSPSKGGIGINRIRAGDYLEDSSSMKQALVEYAISACKVKFGQSPGPLPTLARLVRHKMTAACKDTPVPLEKESCVASCPIFQ